MSFSFSDEQVEFRGMLRRFLQTHAPTTAVRRQMDTEHAVDVAVWRQLCDELGSPASTCRKTVGGQEFSPVELGIVMEETRRALLCAPYFSCCVPAARALHPVATPAEQRVVARHYQRNTPRNAVPGQAGQRLRTVQHPTRGPWEGGDEVTLDGTGTLVLDGTSAEQLPRKYAVEPKTAAVVPQQGGPENNAKQERSVDRTEDPPDDHDPELQPRHRSTGLRPVRRVLPQRHEPT